MKFSFYAKRLAIFSAFVALSACGGGDIAGGTTEFDTVMLSAQTATLRLESDVLTGNTCTDGNSADGLYSSDYVNVSVKSTIYPKFTGTASPVAIDSYTVEFMPVNTVSPQLPSKTFSTMGTTVSAGGTVTIPVAVATEDMKYNTLVLQKNLLPCSGTIYEYYVKVTFNAVETFGGKRGSVSASLNVAFADRNN